MNHTDRRFRSFAGAMGLGVILLGTLAALWFSGTRPSPEQLLSEAESAFTRQRYAEAETLALRAHSDSPVRSPALLLAGKAALQQHRPHDAVEYLDRVPGDGSDAALEARFLAGDVLKHRLHRLSEAELQLRAVLALDPRHAGAHRLLVNLIDLCGREWEAISVRLELLRQDAFTPRDLMGLAQRDAPNKNANLLAEVMRRRPEDPLAKLAAAVAALRQRQTEPAEALLQELRVAAPQVIEAQVRLGTLLLEARKIVEFVDWLARLPQTADAHPQTWALRGEHARSQGDLQGAARCYWEALRRDCCHQPAAYQLGQVLLALGQPERAAPFVERAVMLQDMLLLMKRHAAAPGADSMRRAAQLCEHLGLLWEAWGWSRGAMEHDPQLLWAAQTVERLSPRLTADLPRTAPELDPTRGVDLSDFPIPQSDSPTDSSPLSTLSSIDHTIQFADEADAAGLNFSYFNDDDPSTPAARPFEFTGGGVAVLDYDSDGWPDVYLTQGCPFPPQDEHPPYDTQREYVDRLFRNLGDGRFDDVTEAAGLSEDRYSQGVTVGDFNSDGHPDLYIANLDANRLYRNNGDGTFSDVTVESGTGGNRWTTSCLMADLNGDAWPDIYAVNYLTGSDVFERICRNSRGEPRICTPHDFAPAQDQLYRNLGDGRFEEWTDEGGVTVPRGKGLGIVAADFTGTGRLDLFVANDTDGNCFFVNETPSPGAPPLFRERAIVSGLAYDRDGLTQACMGVAAGDADADGLIDLFVTNYYDEANTLYLHQPGRLFLDATREAGLREPSLPMLGFGTQFLDGELDGHPDLIATNGHVEDNRRSGIPYQMRPQYFRNQHDGRFVELSPASLGPYFQQELLGRGLARLDWNRDGREDVVISHLDAPAALLTNRSPAAGHFISLQLRGVVASRDAIGTAVRIRSGQRTWSE